MHGVVAGLLLLAAMSAPSPRPHLLGDTAQEPRFETATSAHASVSTCNGSAALCARRVDEVTFAATHNSMSAEADGWLWPNQVEGIRAQLDAGIRAFLIDTHYWENPAAGPAFMGRVHASVRGWLLQRTAPPADRTVYLCHGVCAAGSIPLLDALCELSGFLDTNPNEVVILAVEDHVRSTDTERTFREAGLLSRVYAHPLDAPWPTLAELLGRGQQVIVQAENAGRASQWYGPMYREVWDTSYRTRTADGFDCDRERGSTANALLLLNHWIDRPSKASANEVNSRDSLLRHVQQCVAQHGKTPNLLAVDFAAIGDLVGTVATLNAEASALPSR